MQLSPRKTWFWLRGNSGGTALAGIRRNAGLTQAELAQQLGIDRTTVLNMEAGRNPAISRFVQAFHVFGYDLIAVPRTARVTVSHENGP